MSRFYLQMFTINDNKYRFKKTRLIVLPRIALNDFFGFSTHQKIKVKIPIPVLDGFRSTFQYNYFKIIEKPPILEKRHEHTNFQVI